MHRGGGHQRSLRQTGAKSLELQIRIGRDFRETSAWPQHWENALQYRHRQCLQESTEVSRYRGDISVKKESYKQIYAADVWNKLLITHRSEGWLTLRFKSDLCVGSLRSRPFISVSFCLYLGRIQSKSCILTRDCLGLLTALFPVSDEGVLWMLYRKEGHGLYS